MRKQNLPIQGTQIRIGLLLHIIEEAERKNILNPGDTIIETTSGNTQALVLQWPVLLKGINVY